MAFIFRKKNKTEAAGPDQIHDRLLRKMVNTCLRLQTRWARWMDRRAEHLSRRTLFLLLLAFIVLADGYCIYLIVQSFSGNQASAFSVTPILKPGHVLQTDDTASQPDMITRKTDNQQFVRFRGYMDSLTRSPVGKAMHDSILLRRPGLPDSIRLIEKIYQSKIKN